MELDSSHSICTQLGGSNQLYVTGKLNFNRVDQTNSMYVSECFLQVTVSLQEIAISHILSYRHKTHHDIHERLCAFLTNRCVIYHARSVTSGIYIGLPIMIWWSSFGVSLRLQSASSTGPVGTAFSPSLTWHRGKPSSCHGSQM